MNDRIFKPPELAWHEFALRTMRPETPLFAWLEWLDETLAGQPSRFGDRQVVLDLSGTRLHGPGMRALMQELSSRDFRVVGLSGIEAADLGPEAPRLPPVLAMSSPLHDSLPPVAVELIPPVNCPLVITRNVRSGQEIVNPKGDVTIIGSVSSGAEVVAAGSIHVYGTLQGRVTAGDAGSIFCQKLEAELLRIGAVFLAADDMPAALRGRAARAWRDGDEIQFAAL
jgi:septum site-determining protein MinC